MLPQFRQVARGVGDAPIASASGASKRAALLDQVQHRAPGRAGPEARQPGHDLDQRLDVAGRAVMGP
jgi:hypothetical protein